MRTDFMVERSAGQEPLALYEPTKKTKIAMRSFFFMHMNVLMKIKYSGHVMKVNIVVNYYLTSISFPLALQR